MGVQGTRGTGNAKVPSHTAYFVAMGGVLGLLLLVCCYFVFFCLRRVKELSHHEFQEVRSVRPPPPPVSPTAYPVQPGVRDSATAMALLCRSVPPDSVFPTSPLSSTRGVAAFSPSTPSLSRLPTSPTSPNRRSFAYYTSPGRSPLSLAAPSSRSPLSPSRGAPSTPRRPQGKSHKLPAIILSPASQASTPLPPPTVIPIR